jgi:hypothetical protein
MVYATDGAIPRDTTGFPVGSVYTPGVGTVAQQGGAVSTDTTGEPYAPGIVQQVAPLLISATLQNAAAATGNGTAFSVTGMTSVVFTVTQTGFSGTITFQGSEDGTNYSNILVTQLGQLNIPATLASISSTTVTSTTVYGANISGLQSLLVPITRSAGTVTVTAHANIVGSIVAAPPIVLVQSAKSNYALAAGTGTTPVTIKNSAGYLKAFMVTTTASAALTFYDNASAASGTALYVTASNIAAGTLVTVDMPFSNGLTVSQASGTMAATIAYI